MKKLLLLTLLASNVFAFSTTNIQYLYGSFNDNSYIFDTRNGGKSTLTIEHFSSYNYGDIYGFIDHSIADDKFKFHNSKTDTYMEIAPRVNISKLTSTDLSFSFVKELYLAFQYNAGNDYNGYLFGIGSDLNLYGFDMFGINIYKKNQNISDNTYQLSPFYKSKTIYNIFHIYGFIDWTEDDFLMQNQFLFDISKYFKVKNLHIGAEWNYYKQNPHNSNFKTDVKSNTVQAMIKYAW